MPDPITSSVDAYVNEATPNQNHGDAIRLQVSDLGSNKKNAYIFMPRPFPLDATILSATLRIYLAENAGGTTTLTCERVKQAWKEQRICFDIKPDVATGPESHPDTASITGLIAGAVVEFDVKDMLQDVADGSDYHGFRITTNTNAVNKFYSSDDPSSANWPTLELEWAEKPETPDNLTPDGGQALTHDAPVLAWRFRDPSTDGIQAHSRVQIDNTEDFASPEYDSGQEPNVNSSWDTEADGYAGIPSGQTRFWRVMVWDETGEFSDWSDVAEMRYVPVGSLTLNNPPNVVGSTVEDITPPIDWTLTGAVQESYRVILERVNNKGLHVEIWRQPHIVSDDHFIHLPKDLLKSNRTFRITLDVWDDEDRVTSFGNPAYTRIQRSFTYQRNGDPGPVTSFAATPDGHFVILTWSRVGTPDYFSLRVNGEEELSRISPADVAIGGGNYRMVWCRARGTVPALYEIEAVVNDGTGKHEHSDGNPTATATTDPYGIVLVDDEDLGDPTFVMMRGVDGPGFDIGETAETFRLVAVRKPVRITDSIGGYEGSVNGMLMSNAEKDTFEDLKGSLRTLRLLIADTNIPIVMGEVSLTPQPEHKTRWKADFEVFQVGEFTFELGD